MIKKVVLVIVLLLASTIPAGFADEQGRLTEKEKAHQKALQIYNQTKDYKQALKILKKAGIDKIVNKSPEDASLSKSAYATILNDYAYFLYLDKKLGDAQLILNRVIQIDPNRTVAYLNRGDVFRGRYEQIKDDPEKIRILEICIGAYLDNYRTYSKQMESMNKSHLIPERVKNEISRYAKLPTTPSREAINEKEEVFQIVKKLEFDMSYDLPDYDKESVDALCKVFLKDFKERRDIEFIEPIIQTDDYNNPELQAYLSKCPKLQLNKSIDVEPRIADTLEGLSEEELEEELEKIGTAWYTTYNFKLYHVDMDNNPENGKEYVFYGEMGYSERRATQEKEEGGGMHGEYRIVDLERCKGLGVTWVSKSIGYYTRKPTGKYNGILKYKGKYYIYDAWKYYPILSLAVWKVSKVSAINGLCHFKQSTKGGKK